ncbi:MAG: hypothetical protein WBA15_03640 [Mesorhizobium sp.]
MEGPFISNSGVAYPGDMKMLKQVYDRFCEANRIERDGSEAEEIAQAAMLWFQSGAFDESKLWAKLSEFHAQRNAS